LATTTPNFGWPVPTSTDLVKDGATAMEALGDAIDTSMVDLKGGTTGQVLAKASSADMDFSWVAQDDSNAIQNSIVDAKGDLIAASAADTPARLAVGNNGETLVADSSATTGLRYQATQAAGKNYLINGGFDIWQRGTTFVGSGTGVYLADRWVVQNAGTTPTYSRQSTGAPNGSQYVMRIASSASGTYANVAQLIETANVELLWGSTATFSVKLRKNATFTQNIELYIQKSATVDAALGATWSTIVTKTISNASLPTGTGVTDWFSDYISGAIPNDGTANSIRVVVAQAAAATGSGQYWEFGNCQLEIGSVPTQFSRAGGTIQGELAACQRYYFRSTSGNAYAFMPAQGVGYNSTTVDLVGRMPVTMRVAPTSVDFSTLRCYDDANALPVTNLIISSNQPDATYITATVASGGVQFRPYFLGANNSSTAYIGYSAEL